MNEAINKGYSKMLSTVVYFNSQQEIWQVPPFLQIKASNFVNITFPFHLVNC